MVQKQTMLEVADNSGARVAMCIGLFGGRRKASVGDLITVSIKSAIPRGKVPKGEVCKAVVVRVRERVRRGDGSYFSFSNNAVVLVNEQMEPIGTRIFGPVRKLHSGFFMKIMSLAVEVL